MKIKKMADPKDIAKIPDELAKPGEFTMAEMLAIAASREVRDDDVVFAGTGLPMIGILTAQCLDKPNAVLIYEAGIMDGRSIHIPGSVSDQRAANLSSTLGGLTDTFGFYLQNNLCTLGYLGGASIDKYGGVNVTAIGNYYKPQHRFTGSGGNADIGTMSKRTVFIMLQEKRRFVERNEYTTTPGWWCYSYPDREWRPKREVWAGSPYAEYGPSAVISTMGVYRFDKDGIMYLETYHPGTTPEKVKENVSFDLNISRVTGETKRPTYREMFIIREIVDFERIFLPAKLPDFPPHVAKIIEEIEKT